MRSPFFPLPEMELRRCRRTRWPRRPPLSLSAASIASASAAALLLLVLTAAHADSPGEWKKYAAKCSSHLQGGPSEMRVNPTEVYDQMGHPVGIAETFPKHGTL